MIGESKGRNLFVIVMNFEICNAYQAKLTGLFLWILLFEGRFPEQTQLYHLVQMSSHWHFYAVYKFDGTELRYSP